MLKNNLTIIILTTILLSCNSSSKETAGYELFLKNTSPLVLTFIIDNNNKELLYSYIKENNNGTKTIVITTNEKSIKKCLNITGKLYITNNYSLPIIDNPLDTYDCLDYSRTGGGVVAIINDSNFIVRSYYLQ